MTSGSGIMHEEMPRHSPQGTVFGFQLWVNLPAALKMSQPRYQEVSADSIPAVEKDGAVIRIVAGEINGVQGPVTEIAANPVYLDVEVKPGSTFSYPIPQGHTAVAYVFEGAAEFGVDETGKGERLEAVHLVVFNDGDALQVQTTPDSSVRFMLIAGAPFKEPIVPYGPFVMNTPQEIQQALADLRNGTFVKV
jgi:redox-sensitive bicupin YhaK (pirin superfamily)